MKWLDLVPGTAVIITPDQRSQQWVQELKGQRATVVKRNGVGVRVQLENGLYREVYQGELEPA